MTNVTDLARAYHFAARKHVDQRRKGAAGEPYMNHLTEVAELVSMGTDGEDLELVIAAVLHDTVEDTDTTLVELARLFGARAAGLVAEVTDDKLLPTAERKRLQVEHAAHASLGAKVIKLADKTANLRALEASPPTGWGTTRVSEYVAWAEDVVKNCRGANLRLEVQFDTAAAALRSKVAAGNEAQVTYNLPRA